MNLLKNWKIHLLCLLITLLAEGIGIIKFGIIVFLPLLYSLVIGLIISIPKLKIMTEEQMEAATDYLNISIMLLMTKIGLGIGPNLHIIMNSGWALILQELGHLLGTIILGLPVALLVGMRRESIGACYSIDREANVAIIIDRYGFHSPEGRGVMGMYICGTLFGAMWISILSGVISQLNVFHPLALAMGAGIGSASMMAAATGSIVAVHPEFEKEIMSIAGAANLLTSVVGVYFSLFVSLPLMEKLYTFCARKFRHTSHEMGGSKNNTTTAETANAATNTAHNAVYEPNTSEPTKAPQPALSFSQKCIKFFVIAFIAAIITAIGNILDGKHLFSDSLQGCLILAGISFLGAVISYLPSFKKLPMVFWVSILGVILSIPGVPGAMWFTKETAEVTFLATTTPVLAYAGLSLGKDLDAFKQLSWRIVPVALAVATGTFLCATLVAEVVLHWEGLF
ncbi:MAG: DUF3100 domain-containing protein [Veillonella caviae]|nr:DUF3100 domain-containing protein [Veillonella caviae]